MSDRGTHLDRAIFKKYNATDPVTLEYMLMIDRITELEAQLAEVEALPGKWRKNCVHREGFLPQLEEELYDSAQDTIRRDYADILTAILAKYNK